MNWKKKKMLEFSIPGADYVAPGKNELKKAKQKGTLSSMR
jgi:hypothetical protein